MMRTAILAFVLALPAAFPSGGIAGPEDAVIEKYSSSKNLPDWVAYQMFLIIVEGLQYRTDDHPGHVMSAAFGLDLNTREGSDAAQQRLSWLAASAAEARHEADAEVRRILCPSGWSEMAYEQVKKARFESEDARSRVYDEYYRVALEYLPPAERDPFRVYMVGIKERTGMVRFDPERYFGDEAEREAFEYQASVCTQSLNPEN